MTTRQLNAEDAQQLGDFLDRVASENPELWALTSQIQVISNIRIEPSAQEARIVSADSTNLVVGE